MAEQNEVLEAKLDELEAEINEIKKPSEAPESPPGHMDYDAWIKAGKDPEEYKGAKAYAYEHERNESFDKMKGEIESQKNQVRQLTESMSDWQREQTGQIKTRLEAELAKATEDENVKEAIAVTKQLESLKTTEPKGESSVILDYRKATPILDHSSSEFSKEFNAEVEEIFNGYTGKKDTDEAAKRVLDYAVREAKKVFPDLFTSSKNSRETGPNSKRTTTTKSNPRDKLKDYAVNSRNPGNATAAVDMMDALAEKYGDKFDKEQFARNLTGE